MKKILLVQTGFIGDVILSSPLISALKKYNPDSEVSLLTTPLAVSLFEGHDELKEVLTFDKRSSRSGLFGLLKMASELRSKSYDEVYSLHKSSRTSLLLYLSGIKKRYSFKESKLNFLYTKTAPRSDLSHDVLRNLAVLRVHDLNPADYVAEMSLGMKAESVTKAKELTSELGNNKTIVVAPGSVWATKRLPKETFLEVVRTCLKDQYQIILLGGPDDISIGEFIEKNLDGKSPRNFLNLIGKCALNVSAEVIRLADIVLSNDSSPLHMASATGTPVVATFCATVPEQGFGPWMVPFKIIEVKDLDCRPCGRHGGNICPTGTHACQKGIGAEEIVAALKELLAG